MHNVLEDLLLNFSESHKPFRDIFCQSKNSHCLIHPSCPLKARSRWLGRLYKITCHFPPPLMCPQPLLQVLRLLTCESGHHSPAASDTWLHPFSFTSATGHCSLSCMLHPVPPFKLHLCGCSSDQWWSPGPRSPPAPWTLCQQQWWGRIRLTPHHNPAQHPWCQKSSL